jgi:hypothetical protein
MPFLPVDPFQINYELNYLAVWGVMNFPNDRKKREEFIATHIADSHLKTDKNIMDKVTPDFLEELLHAPSIDTIQNYIVKIYAQAYQAALIVIYLYSLQQLGKSPSMNRALRLVENRYSKSLAKQNKMRPIAHSEESIRKNWRIYWPASHLWAAHINFYEKAHINSSHDFDLFLARSEFFLSFCLGIFSERVNEPLFNKDDMWCIPSWYHLPVIEPLEKLEIDDQIRYEIETYSVV